MTKVSVYNLLGEKKEDIELLDSVFGVESNNDLLHQVYVSMYANRRTVIAHAKDRGERAGSGKKPWKQKGTGNARVGSVRTPVWRKGGVVFGPSKDRNFSKKINRKMKVKALKIALSEKVKDNKIVIVDEIKLKENKTKVFSDSIKKLSLDNKNILISFSEKEKEYRKASRNIKNVKNILASRLNVLDIMNSKIILISKDSIKYLEEKYS